LKPDLTRFTNIQLGSVFGEKVTSDRRRARDAGEDVDIKVEDLVYDAGQLEKLPSKIDDEQATLTAVETDHRAARQQLSAVELMWSSKVFA